MLLFLLGVDLTCAVDIFLCLSAGSMAKMQSSSKEQVFHKATSNEQSVLKQGVDDDENSGGTTSSAGENRYPGWPGTSVFRMLIPSHKVGAIIGHKGERVRRLCEETKACVRIIGGHICAAEQAVSSPLHS